MPRAGAAAGFVAGAAEPELLDDAIAAALDATAGLLDLKVVCAPYFAA